MDSVVKPLFSAYEASGTSDIDRYVRCFGPSSNFDTTFAAMILRLLLALLLRRSHNTPETWRR